MGVKQELRMTHIILCVAHFSQGTGVCLEVLPTARGWLTERKRADALEGGAEKEIIFFKQETCVEALNKGAAVCAAIEGRRGASFRSGSVQSTSQNATTS